MTPSESLDRLIEEARETVECLQKESLIASDAGGIFEGDRELWMASQNFSILQSYKELRDALEPLATKTGSILMPLDLQDDDTQHTIRAKHVKLARSVFKSSDQLLTELGKE